MTSVFARYPGSARDEAVALDGSVRPPFEPVAGALEELGGVGLTSVVGAMSQERRVRGVVFGSYVDGRLEERPFPICPVPRVLPAADWAHLARGVEQRHRALNAFLADVYRPAGRRRTDDDRQPEIVRAGLVPEWVVTASPGFRPAAVGWATPGQQRITVSGLDLLRGPDGWVVLEDNLRVPSGIGYALSNRTSGRTALPALYADAEAAGLVDPTEAVALLRAALADAAPAGCDGVPQLGLLTDGPHNTAWFEHRLLAEALGAPIATPDRLWPTATGGVAVQVDGERVPVDVLYRRFDEADLAGHLTPTGIPVDVLLGEAVRAGQLAVANVPGNGVADDKATYRYVPEMIDFYLDERPVLATVPTWLLAEPGDLAAVRDRLDELVVKPVDGFGGRGVVFGPQCSAVELAELQAEVLASPHRFVAQEPVDFSTVPTVVDGLVVPRRADLRVFAVAGSTTRALPAPLTRVALGEGSLLVNSSQGGGSKDTWVLPG
ncbi:circularly permuted type 2 ATP-grasp protein [Modestobacter sp. L9-4]|uniref:circularly permuted type 2 ATP-grasp protein n=1 Tax=Modestobacter sp. L9-4 TaxID=2851567 RepID=UPI001C767167|nr:circularly permuted type 2 ATP-grasp protein [Modestobacter sp. L9-4]QXG74905.1 circularly permuted type 2 ATP-grasp protein [Modestobacter sp. L9-4]